MENHLRACELVILLNKQKLSHMREMPKSQENASVPGNLTSSVHGVSEPEAPYQNIEPEETFYGGNKKVFLTTLAYYFKVVSVPTQSGEKRYFWLLKPNYCRLHLKKGLRHKIC